MTSPDPEQTSAPADVSVTVVRSGGIAGTRREWRAEPPAEETPRWIELIEGCPWDAVLEVSGTGADRFVWRIDARCGPEQRGADLPDSEVHGPWRDLVDEVRQSAAPPISRASEPDAAKRDRAQKPR